MQNTQWNQSLVNKYNVNGPRYTSYPTALALDTGFAADQVISALQTSNQPLSLYIHLPFCHKLCYYCGCNRVITRHQDKADSYLDALADEMRLYAPLIAHRGIRNLHLGGGTPTFLNEQQLSRLMSLLADELAFHPGHADEVSIEIDPRSCSLDKLAHLRHLGFNRVSYGVQDFNQDVQIAINRVQSEELVSSQVHAAKALGFSSINLDLVYGLPHQTLDNFHHSLDKVIALSPDRVSMFSYAHLPTRFAAQRKIADETLLQGADKQALLLAGIERLNAAGYQFIGMDHFAKPDDRLAQAQREGHMQRNFQGYTTHGSDALLGLGVSSISQVNGVIWQHEKDLQPYYRKLAHGQRPISKGIVLHEDDRLRAALIAELICHFKLNIDEFEKAWGITFSDYFAPALRLLQRYQDDGLVKVSTTEIEVTDAGRLWVRIICAAFDAYLQGQSQQYSKVI
ncbi:oxygen-independent coproporphyrinogen III oxidase [Aliidiomarina soli]|uniref:Coproporphyrinogen-III oxidase n=1 Tax=Aliidiomarina soli TaxID=1928574 RepID=A0A432WJJ7_9GAMM|nr:oxygen-independent coproporphyrinogen III oxidase [Aliidiomarina soli]RUO33944.1 oxygen-independent coproporphyrinogen III oxidase [Aliidiomarina soli]